MKLIRVKFRCYYILPDRIHLIFFTASKVRSKLNLYFLHFILKYVDSSIGHFTPFGTYTNDPSVNTAEFKLAKKLSVNGTTEPMYFLNLDQSMMASDIEQKITPCCFNFSLYVVATDTLSNTASTATPASCFCSNSGIPSLSNVLLILGQYHLNFLVFLLMIWVLRSNVNPGNLALGIRIRPNAVLSFFANV